MLETLQQIDKDLIKLLGKRIALLRESKLSGCSEETFDPIQFLAQTGVPEFVWESLVTSCAAASTATSSSSTPVKPKQVTVIGGHGKMGRFFTQQLSTAGHNVRVLEHDNWDQAEQLLGKAELVLVCVPIEQTLTVIQKASQYLAPYTALADITSIKTPTIQAMLLQHEGPVLSLHPMFGPEIQSFLSQNVVVCTARKEKAFQWLLEFIESQGGKLIVCTPQEHDRMMVVIQAIRHFSTFSLGSFLAEEGIDINRSLDLSSPSYRLELSLVNRLFTQSAPMVVNIMLATKERREAIVRLANTYNRLAQLVVREERDALCREFEAVGSIFGEEIICNPEKSTYEL
jgi:prephenate dehydrogenase/chorismate mutase/prephenate dehydrogenase